MVSRQFSIFVMMGIACAVIDIGVMQLLIWAGMYYLVATTVGFATGLIANFLLHTHITFSKSYSHGALMRFMAVVLLNYVLTLLTVSLFHMWLNMTLLGKLLSLPLVAVNGFLLSKHWVYR
ncbi:MAG: GtrA family protein [Betaproteobacteria bacterium]|nr:GtrA family protein [Betaproteobacteria bacterium]